MKRSLYRHSLFALATLFSSVATTSSVAHNINEQRTVPAIDKTILGAVETFTIKECGVDFVARIDTGADLTSVHAMDLQLVGNDHTNAYSGKPVKATLHNHLNEPCVVETKLNRIIRVKSSHGSSIRYEIPLTLVYNNREHQVFANLRNRSNLTYKLLVGRDLLTNGFLVDVNQ